MASNSAIGLDIGTHSATVAQVRAGRGRAHVTNFGGVRLPQGAVREGEVVDPTLVGDSVRRLLAATGIKAKKVHLGVANQRVVVRQVDLPWMELDELRSSLRFQVQEHIPIAVDEAELDFHVLDEYDTDEARMLRILLVAAAKEMVASHVAAAEAAGLRAIGVDLNPFGMLRALQSSSPLDQEHEALIDVGAGVTTIVVHEAGIPRFVRILVLGGDDITQALASALDLEVGEAEQVKRDVEIARSNGDRAAGVAREHADRFVDEIRNSLDYYRSQGGGSRIARVVLTGGGAFLSGLPTRVERALRVPTEIGNPLDHLPAKGSVWGPDQLQRVGPVLTTAVGLALGAVE